MNSIEDRPDYAGSMNPLTNPADQVRRRIQDQGGIAAQFGSYSASPIKVFTVCVDQMSGKYMAFLGSDPAQRVTGDSRLEAVALLLAHTKTIVMTEID